MPTALEATTLPSISSCSAGGAVYPLVGDVLLARQGSGSEAHRPRGGTVGVPGLGALLHFMLRRQLEANGVDPSSVKYVELGISRRPTRSSPGRSTPIRRRHRFTARILQSGAGYEVANWPRGIRLTEPLTVVHLTLRKWGSRTRTRSSACEAMREANAYAKTHVDELYAAIAKYTKLPPQVVSSLPPPNLAVDVTPEQIKFWIDLVKEQGVIKGNPDPKSILYEP